MWFCVAYLATTSHCLFGVCGSGLVTANLLFSVNLPTNLTTPQHTATQRPHSWLLAMPPKSWRAKAAGFKAAAATAAKALAVATARTAAAPPGAKGRGRLLTLRARPAAAPSAVGLGSLLAGLGAPAVPPGRGRGRGRGSGASPVEASLPAAPIAAQPHAGLPEPSPSWVARLARALGLPFRCRRPPAGSVALARRSAVPGLWALEFSLRVCR